MEILNTFNRPRAKMKAISISGADGMFGRLAPQLGLIPFAAWSLPSPLCSWLIATVGRLKILAEDTEMVLINMFPDNSQEIWQPFLLMII